MRIAFITPEFVTEDYFSGGLANYLHRMTKALADQGHETHVIILSTDRRDSFKHGEVWVHPIIVNPRRPWVRKIIRRFLYDAGQWLSFSYQAWRRLESLHKAKPIDIVQLTNYRACGLFTAAFSRIPNVTRISSFEQAWNDAAGRQRNLASSATEWLERLQLRLSKRIYAPSQALATMLADRAGIREVTVIRTPFYIEITHTDPSPYRERLQGKRYLLFVGRYQIYKGIQVLAEALPTVLAALPDCEAVFVGKDMPNHLGPSMQDYIRSLCPNMEGRLHFFDQTRHEQLYPIIEGARLMVLPSLVDNLPNTLLEAMAFGKPVVGTIGASFDEVIEDGVSGFLVPIDDPDALAATIIRAWSHPDLESIGQQAKERIRQFRPEVTVNELLTYFETVITERASRNRGLT